MYSSPHVTLDDTGDDAQISIKMCANKRGISKWKAGGTYSIKVSRFSTGYLP